MKRILIFSLAYIPYIGGAEVAVKEITDRVSDYEFDLIALRWNSKLPKVERIGNVTVYRIGFSKDNPSMQDLLRFPMYLTKVLYPPLAFFKAFSLHRKNHYSALWAIMSYTAFPIVFFKLLYSKIPLILTLQEGDNLDVVNSRLRIRAVLPLYRRIFRITNVLQAISTYLADFGRVMGYRGITEVIPNGVDTAAFSKEFSIQELLPVRSLLTENIEGTVLITTSRLYPKNAVSDVIKALALLPESITFAVLGTGPEEDYLRGLTAELVLQNRVRFLGHVEHKDLPKYLKASDIFIRPSLSEGQGVSFIEAMAARLPVIATQVGGIADFLFDPDKNPGVDPTGLAVEVGEPADIAKAVQRLLDDTALREKIVQNAFSLVEGRYDWNRIAKEMQENVFDSAVKG